MGDISRDLSTLMRQELELAKAELKQEAAKAAQGAGMLGGAGLAGYFLVLFLSLALAWALSAPVGDGWAHLIVGVLWGLVAATLFLLGRKRLQQVNPKLEQTVETVSEIPSALKPNA
ncbi:MAG: phage holin family protein [Actinomycetota bacterium]|nr:phage holin family protein [Actinomycetota bacterium]